MGFCKLGVPRWGPHHKDCGALGSMLGSLSFWKLPGCDEDWARITVDCFSRKLRASVKVQEFDNGPNFAEHRIQVESAQDLLPRMPGCC